MTKKFPRRAPVLSKSQTLLVERYGPFKSRISRNGHCWKLEWYDVATHQLYQTYVDTDMDNFTAWESVLYNDQPWGCYEGLAEGHTRKQYDTPVITADSIPERWLVLTQEQCYAVAELDIQEQRQPAPNVYGSLFQ